MIRRRYTEQNLKLAKTIFGIFVEIVSRSYRNIFKIVILPLSIFVGVVILYEVVQGFLGYYHTRKHEVSVPSELMHRENLTPIDPILGKDDEMSGVPNTQLEEPVMSTGIKPNRALLKLSLIGTVNAGMENAMAVIENKEERKQKLYRVGNVIAGGVLSKILKEKVFIRIDGSDYVLKMDSTTSIEEEDGSVVMVSRQELENALEDVKSFISQVRIKPHIFDDGTGGLVAQDIKPGSLFDKLGFENGDIIQDINGAVIKSPHKLAAIHEGLKVVPLNILSFDSIGSKAEDILLGIDNQAGGVVSEVSKVYQKVKSGEEIPVRLTRDGNKKAISLKFR